MADRYYITINGEKIRVSKEVYNAYCQMRRHERTLAEKDSRNFVLKYEDFADSAVTGEEQIYDFLQPSVEEIALTNIIYRKLHKAIEILPQDERELITAIYFQARHSGISIPGWDQIEIEANKTDVSVNFINPKDNAGRYYMQFTVYLDGEDEPLAETGLIRGGESALELHLAHPLSAGEYPATVHIQPYRVQDNTPTNNADIEFTLIVK